jgi:hypothetical protein
MELENRWDGPGSPDSSSDLDHPRSLNQQFTGIVSSCMRVIEPDNQDNSSAGYGSATGSTSSITRPGQESPASLDQGSRGATSAPISILH